MEYIYLIAGIAAGFLIMWLILRNSINKQKLNTQQQLAALDREKTILQERNNILLEEKDSIDRNLTVERTKVNELTSTLAAKEEQLKYLQEKMAEQMTQVENLQKKFKEEFENLANRILDEKSQKFTDLNKINLDQIISPLKEKISSFEKKVEETYQKGHDDQTKLRMDLKSLHEQNARITEEANNLAKALKGDVKKMGNWGEIILERVLERSGLTKGVEYEREVQVRNEEGDFLRPDVVIRLPENKNIIIDSKVSLVHYEAYSNSDIPEEREKYLKLHIESIRNHVRNLSEKKYQHVDGLLSPDFVLLFLPIESAFSAAVQGDISLFNFAWERKIVIVSPTTLLATLKTVESIWRQEKQTQNALEIARQGGALFDKFVAFLNDLEKLGNQLQTVNKTYDEAHKKLSSGKGDLITRAKRLQELGAKTAKELPDKYDIAEDNLLNEVTE